MDFALRLDRGQASPAFAWLLLVAALLSTPAVRLFTGSLSNAIAGLRAAPVSTPAPAVDPWSATPFVLRSASVAEREQATNCLAAAIYYEAGTESLSGQRAVAQVVLNRVRDPKFPGSICGVVFQGARRHTGCQFSFVCDGSSRRRQPGPRQVAHARIVAEEALAGRVEPEVGTATHYHASYVHPSWGRRLAPVSRVGNHIFYRRLGEAGAAAALTKAYAGGELRFASLGRKLIRSSGV
jgi:spore germination cell wall hydrolase CwlJ-like protein